MIHGVNLSRYPETVGNPHRRSRLQMKGDLLRAIREGPCGKELKTHLMYKANLDWTRTEELLRELEKNQMISFELTNNQHGKDPTIHGPEVAKGHKVVTLTDRGRVWLESYELLIRSQNPNPEGTISN
jgi:predicted transcriptional regulator